MTGRRLGRRPPEPRRLAAVPHLHDYATRTLPTPPEDVDWGRNVAPGGWGMCLNDQIGDCTAAGVSHAYTTWESYCPPLSYMSDNEVVALYSATGGYQPGNPATDQGASCLDVLNYWVRHGVSLAGERDHLQSFCQIAPKNHLHVRQGLWLFGCLYIGMMLTEAQQTQQVWDAGGDQTPWGGHCVLIVAADASGLTCVTWGALQKMTWAFWDQAVEEVYPLLSKRWVDFDGSPVSPADFRWADLQADLQALRHAV